MIELLLEADRALAVGMLDQAERMYRQAIETDPRNAIAVAGLARVALERGDDGRSHALAAAALLIDPENLQAQRIASRTADVLRARGEALPEPAGDFAPGPRQTGAPPTEAKPEAAARRGLLRRLFGGR